MIDQKMAKTRIFLDFDGTIFDTSLYREILFKIFEGAGFSAEEILEKYREECLDYKFSPEGLAKRLREVRVFDQKSISTAIEESYSQVSKFIYTDTFDFLKSLDRDLYILDLLSLGDIGFQRKKIVNAGVDLYFDNIYITDIQKWKYLDKLVTDGDRFAIIDDRADTIRNVKKSFPNCISIEIQRKDADKDDPMRTSVIAGASKDDDNLKIKSLSQAITYL